MDERFKARRAARLAAEDWQTGVASSHDELDAYDLSFWRTQPPGVRLQACFDIARDAWSIRGDGSTFVTFDENGVRRRTDG